MRRCSGSKKGPVKMASRKELLDSIRPDMRLTKSFFLKVYGYGITQPGFPEEALKKLEAVGCANARNYYECVVAEYNYQHDQELRKAAEWYLHQCKNEKSKEVKKNGRKPEYQFAGFPEDW